MCTSLIFVPVNYIVDQCWDQLMVKFQNYEFYDMIAKAIELR